MLSDRMARSIKRLGLTAIAVIGLGAGALSPLPANAQIVVDAPPYPYYQPAPPPYYYPPPAPRVAYRSCGFGWHLAAGHWDRWGRWHPPRCRPNW